VAVDLKLRDASPAGARLDRWPLGESETVILEFHATKDEGKACERITLRHATAGDDGGAVTYGWVQHGPQE
jgi:hypothetical protein